MICCTLKHAFLDTSRPPKYETISYVCGDKESKAKIKLHGSEIQVIATAVAALRRMRYDDKPRTLWIDAICIDGANVNERNHQVGMMHEIYTLTSHNCIYLGPDNGSMPTVMASVEAILREIAIETRDYADFGEILFDPEGHARYSQNPISISINQSGLLEFFENSWFSRLWVVQEGSLSCNSTCYLGQFNLPLVSILRVARWLVCKWFQMPDMTLRQSTHLHTAARIFDTTDRKYGRSFHHNNNLSSLLTLFERSRTFDRKDHLYAIIGLWQMHTRASVIPEILKPDYNLSVSEVFTRATKFAIQETDDLTFLRHVSGSSQGKDDELWPSWVPVFDRHSERFRHPLLMRAAANRGVWPCLKNATNASKTLNVAGVFMDVVTDTNPAVTRDPRVCDMDILRASVESPRPTISWVKALGGNIEARAGVVLQGGSTFRDARATEAESLRDYQSLKRYMTSTRSFPPHPRDLEPSDPDEEKAASRYSDSAEAAGFARAVFHTADGHLGLGPDFARPGDVIAILYGCPWPVMMRPLPETGEYQFLDYSYVYGIMNGEAVIRHQEMGREEDRFRIV